MLDLVQHVLYSTPSHCVTAPVGHWGPYSPDPLRRGAPYDLSKKGRNMLDLVQHVLYSTPSHCVTAPVGHWGPYSPDPLRRFALHALTLVYVKNILELPFPTTFSLPFVVQSSLEETLNDILPCICG